MLSIESQLFAEEEILRLQAHARSERGSHQRQQIGETSQQESANRWSGSHGSEILADNGEVSMKNATHALPAADGKGARLGRLRVWISFCVAQPSLACPAVKELRKPLMLGV